jgi:hypothetical protein
VHEDAAVTTRLLADTIADECVIDAHMRATNGDESA